MTIPKDKKPGVPCPICHTTEGGVMVPLTPTHFDSRECDNCEYIRIPGHERQLLHNIDTMIAALPAIPDALPNPGPAMDKAFVFDRIQRDLQQTRNFFAQVFEMRNDTGKENSL